MVAQPRESPQWHGTIYILKSGENSLTYAYFYHNSKKKFFLRNKGLTERGFLRAAGGHPRPAAGIQGSGACTRVPPLSGAVITVLASPRPPRPQPRPVLTEGASGSQSEQITDNRDRRGCRSRKQMLSLRKTAQGASLRVRSEGEGALKKRVR